MRKMYLTSVGLEKLVDILPKSPRDTKLVYIPTAADPYQDKWFIEADRKKLKDMEFRITEVDINGKSEDQLANLLKDCDVVFIAGGSSFYLLEKVYESGFDKVIRELLEKGVIYAGASAGAVIVCPTIEPISLLDDPSKAPNLKTFKGLNLIDSVILPHYGNKKYSEKYLEIKKVYSNKDYKMIELSDHQAVIVNGDSYKIVNTT